MHRVSSSFSAPLHRVQLASLGFVTAFLGGGIDAANNDETNTDGTMSSQSYGLKDCFNILLVWEILVQKLNENP
uniref:Uncharacterized protein n=1 Tax=Leersia perrieri TaxID=77586 RepID=A0A0D9XHN5_9ORYZ